MTSLSAYAWSEGKDHHLFTPVHGTGGRSWKGKDSSRKPYPWEGKVVYHIEPKQNEFTVAIHIPGYINTKGTSFESNC